MSTFQSSSQAPRASKLSCADRSIASHDVVPACIELIYLGICGEAIERVGFLVSFRSDQNLSGRRVFVSVCFPRKELDKLIE